MGAKEQAGTAGRILLDTRSGALRVKKQTEAEKARQEEEAKKKAEEEAKKKAEAENKNNPQQGQGNGNA